MNQFNEFEDISISKLLEILTVLDIPFVLKENGNTIKSNHIESASIDNGKLNSHELILNSVYTLNIFESSNKLIKDKVRNARHDIYNLINTSLLGFDYIKSKFSLKNDIHRCEVIEKNLNSVTRLLETVFDESNQKPKEQFLLNKVLLDLARIFSTAISKEKNFVYSISDKEFYLSGIREDIFNSVLNLLINADEATSDNGTIKLSFEVDESANIFVEDNGSGISNENQKKVFERGFSTKNKKHESGIGLFNVKKIIEEHGGQISLESKENNYTKFEITFTHNLIRAHHTGTKTILFADDDEMLLELIYDLLSSYEFKIITVKNGNELISKFSKDIDLIIADRNMPNLDGISAVKEIRNLNSIIPVIISTGLTKDESDIDSLKNYNNIHFIDKPYNFEKLLNLINSII
ncbi:MAG: response regulator [Melioribacteraceae bacterium]|nr:response regulator [Melioribacteraceae bacterium]